MLHAWHDAGFKAACRSQTPLEGLKNKAHGKGKAPKGSLRGYKELKAPRGLWGPKGLRSSRALGLLQGLRAP